MTQSPNYHNDSMTGMTPCRSPASTFRIFPIAAALRAEPELQARPVAIFEGKPPLEKIIAVNENAAAWASRPA